MCRLAVTLFLELDQQLRESSAGETSLDDVARELALTNLPINLQTLTELSARLAGHTPEVLRAENLAGCRSITTDAE